MSKKPKTICPLCDRRWTKPPQRLLNGKTCSAKCAGIKGYLAGNHKVTYIEAKLYELLEKLGIEYTKQKPVAGCCVTDAFVTPNFCLFTDGEFWHASPKQVAKDVRITNKLVKEGFEVIRFTEVEMNADFSAIRRQVKKLFGK